MIDTIALTLQAEAFRIQRPEKFTPNARCILDLAVNPPSGREQRLKAVCNPTKEDLRAGIAKPRMTLTGRIDEAGRYSITLRIECSLPKLIFGNNFAELADEDLPLVLTELQARMLSQGVQVNQNTLGMAEVSAIHYGKNILLTDYLTCASVIRELSKANVNGWMDVSRSDYRNGGQLYKTHSNDFEFAIYDKMSDLQKSAISLKRAYEDEDGLQRALLKSPDFDTRKQVIRMEVRLGKRVRIRKTLAKAGMTVMADSSNLTLQELFSVAIARQVLLTCWKPFQFGLPLISMLTGKSAVECISKLLLLCLTQKPVTF